MLYASADDFRMFCGDLGNEVTDDTLQRSFAKYPSFVKAKVVRDRRTNKSKGYGFLSFKDPVDFTRAMREMNGRSCVCLLQCVVMCDDLSLIIFSLHRCAGGAVDGIVS